MKVILKGNVGEVRTGTKSNNSFISFSVAENHGYFDKETNDWILKGTVWHDCTKWFANNDDKFNHYCKLIKKGVPVMITGNTSINPVEKYDEQTGEITNYQNEYIRVDDITFTLNRIENVQYKPKTSDLEKPGNETTTTT